MKRNLIAAVIGLSTLILSQPVKADSDLSYKSVYQSIATSKSDDYRNQEFRVYVLKWLEQDRNYPYQVAMSFCDYRRSGLSTSQIFELRYGELLQRKALENWSEPRFKAYVKITSAGMVTGLKDYCPEFINY